MWSLKRLSLNAFVLLILPVSAADAQCPKKLDAIRLNKIRTGNTFTEGGYEYRESSVSEVPGANTTSFDHKKLWALMGKKDADYTVTLIEDIGTRPGVVACKYQVKEHGQNVTMFLLHGDKR